MSHEQAAAILEQHNLWRRGNDDFPMVEVRLLGEAIDVAIKALRGDE